MGLVALTTLTAHGANFIAMKTENDLQTRSRSIARKATWGVLVTSILALTAATVIRPAIWDNYAARPWGFIFPVLALAAWVGMLFYRKHPNDTAAFAVSTAFIAGMAATTAFGMYPTVLPASTDPAFDLTIYNTATGAYGLGVGLVWWIVGMILAGAYFTYLFYSFRGKIKLPAEGEGY